MDTIFFITVSFLTVIASKIISKRSRRQMLEIVELKALYDERTRMYNKLKDNHNILKDNLTEARNDIWNYETEIATPEDSILIEEMKSYIFHLLQKQNVMVGLNDEDKDWIHKLGGEIEDDD
jgi:hypothetical protein